MKKLRIEFIKMVLALFVLITLSSCLQGASSDDTQSAPPPEQGKEGGISAGGGETLPTNPIDVSRVYDIVRKAKMQIRLLNPYLPMGQSYFPGYASEAEEKFNYGTVNIQTQLEKTDIEVLVDRPCKDKYGHETDASIYASKINTICLSAYRIAPKVSEDTANSEIVALIVHELSHFLGANEEEAVQLQKNAIKSLSFISAYYAWMHLGWHLNDFGLEYEYQAQLAREGFLSAIAQNNPVETKKYYMQTRELLAKFAFRFRETNFFILSFEQYSYLHFLYDKLNLVRSYLCTLTEDCDKEFALEPLEMCFAGQTELTYADLNKNCDLGYKLNKKNKYQYLKMRNVRSLSELPAYLEDVFLFMHDMAQKTQAIATDKSLPLFHLPPTPQ